MGRREGVLTMSGRGAENLKSVDCLGFILHYFWKISKAWRQWQVEA